LAEQTAAAVIDGERKTVTALFPDLKGSTELMRALDPEEARALVALVLQLMMAAVHRYDGYVAQSTGDGIFAMFGAPVAHEDHPQRALHAALAIQEELRRYRAKTESTGRPALEARIGINKRVMGVSRVRIIHRLAQHLQAVARNLAMAKLVGKCPANRGRADAAGGRGFVGIEIVIIEAGKQDRTPGKPKRYVASQMKGTAQVSACRKHHNAAARRGSIDCPLQRYRITGNSITFRAELAHVVSIRVSRRGMLAPSQCRGPAQEQNRKNCCDSRQDSARAWLTRTREQPVAHYCALSMNRR